MPTRPLRPCASPGCPALVDTGRCPRHTRVFEQQRRPAWITAFYNSTAWKKLRALKRSVNPYCEACLDDGVGTPTETIDHVVPITENRELSLVFENLRSLCWPHHNAKTRRGGSNL